MSFNVVSLIAVCVEKTIELIRNVKKGGRTPDQAHMHLITRPIKPKRSPVINIRLADAKYSSWKQFLDTAYWTVELK